MTCCPTCGQERREEFRRGPFLARTGPDEVFYKGLRIAGLTPGQTRLFGLLVRRGTISRLGADLVCSGPESSAKVADVMMCNLRRKLRKLDPDLTGAIVTIWGVGYRLEVS